MKRPLVMIGLTVWLVLMGMIPLFGALAQTATPQPTPTDSINLQDAIPLVREAYGEVWVFEVELDRWRTADGVVLCWEFVTNVGRFCVSTVDGSILTRGDRFDDDVPPPVSTEAVPPPVTTEAVPPPLTTEIFFDDDDVAVTLTQLDAAVAAARAIYPDGSIREADARFIDREGIVIVKIEFSDDREVEVNAETGEVLGFGISRDDDDRDDRDDWDDHDDDHDDHDDHRDDRDDDRDDDDDH